MINNLHDVSFFNTINRLRFLVMIYQNYLFLACIHETTSGNKSFESSMTVKNREITEFLLRHHFFDIIDIVIHMKSHQRTLTHKIFYRNTLVDKTCRSKCIVRRANYHNALLFRFFDQLLGYFCILTDYKTTGINIYRTGLRLIAVSKDDQIIFIDKLRHLLRIGCSDRHFPTGKISMLISGYQCSV